MSLKLGISTNWMLLWMSVVHNFIAHRTTDCVFGHFFFETKQSLSFFLDFQISLILGFALIQSFLLFFLTLSNHRRRVYQSFFKIEETFSMQVKF